jgi:hypothetical protein
MPAYVPAQGSKKETHLRERFDGPLLLFKFHLQLLHLRLPERKGNEQKETCERKGRQMETTL